MKRFYWPQGVLCLALLMPSASSYAQNKHGLSGTLRDPIEFRVEKATTDDYLIELARAGNVNFIADASQFSPETPKTSEDSKRPLGNYIFDFTAARKLSWLRYDASTFLFWTEPDVAALARKIDLDEAVNFAAEPPDDKELTQLLSDYLRRAPGWNERPNFALEVRSADLPPALRAKLSARIQAKIEDQELVLDKAWATDEFWKQVRLWIDVRPIPNRLSLGVRSPHGTSMRTISVLKTPAR